MAKISYSAGMTVHIGAPQNNEYIKLNIEVSEVDTDVNFDDQIQQIHETAHKVMQWADQQLADKMMEALGKK